MLKFDDETTRLLDDAYQGSDVGKRRMANLDALAVKPGERILDIGCGPGLLTLEIARAVGENGEAIGLDPSPDMRKTAAGRCGNRANVRIIDGTANNIPLPDATVDGAVALQVFEYLDNIPGALADARRVLKPEGRLVVGDMHWDSLVWFSDDRPRMDRMIEAWDRHLVERCVPALLPPLMREAGFAVESVTPLCFCDTTLRADGLAKMMLSLIEAYAIQNALVAEKEARAWAEEQRRLAKDGRFFCAITHFVVLGRGT